MKYITIFISAIILALLFTPELPYAYSIGYGSSMEPTMSGDFTIILIERTHNLSISDIGMYESGGRSVVHRVIHKNSSEYIFQGDNNPVADAPVDRQDVIGEVVSHYSVDIPVVSYGYNGLSLE
jgi:signal peptidase